MRSEFERVVWRAEEGCNKDNQSIHVQSGRDARDRDGKEAKEEVVKKVF